MNPRQLVKLFAFLTTGVLLMNCGGTLSRSNARSLIADYPEFSKPLTGDVRLGEVYVMGLQDNNQVYSALKEAGYIQVGNQRDPLTHSANLTEKGQKAAAEWETYGSYMGKHYKVPYAKREVVEVTGISEPNEASKTLTAKFNWRLVPLNDIGKAMRLDENPKQADAVLQKFDDGWRVVNIVGPGLEKEVRTF